MHWISSEADGLKSLLLSEGFHSNIGLVSTTHQFSPTVQSLCQFDRACVLTEMDGGDVMILLSNGDQKKTGQQALAGHVIFF